MWLASGKKGFMVVFFAVIASLALTERVSALEIYNDSGLLEILKKNQLLSDRDIETARGQYPRIDLNGSLQFQYANADASPAAGEVNEVYLRRLNFSLLAHLSERVSILLEPEYGRDMPSVRDAYITYRLPLFSVYAGKHRVPFSAEALQDDTNLRFVERHLTSQLAPDRLPGLSVFRALLNRRVVVQAGVWSTGLNNEAEADLINNRLASNQTFASSSSANDVYVSAIRIGYNSRGSDSFYAAAHQVSDVENWDRKMGLAFGINYYNSGSATNDRISSGATGLNGAKAYGADFSFRLWRIAGEVEYAKRTLDWWQYSQLLNSIAIASEQNSYSAQATVLITDNLSVGLRTESLTYDDNRTMKGSFGQDKDRWLTAGVNYYIKSANSKIQANYIWKGEDMPAGVSEPDNDTLLVQLTSTF